MKANRAYFVISAADAAGFPAGSDAEFAFAGRSNCGKSSLINALAGVHRLARTSNTPGRTRLINWFRIETDSGAAVAFVDLPGYGYARVSRSLREAWRPLVESYLIDRAVLRTVFVLVDARRGPEAEEEELLRYLAERDIDAVLVLTKIDKLPKAKRKPVAHKVRADLGLKRAPVLSSSETGQGLDELWKLIERRM